MSRRNGKLHGWRDDAQSIPMMVSRAASSLFAFASLVTSVKQEGMSYGTVFPPF
jgi:putative SOS response-associated peptidase YedK